MRPLLWSIVAVAMSLPSVLSAGVAVEDDEVVFSLAIDGAGEVFLVGDFNNWNPTLEKMERTGAGYEVRLFLLSGKYRYKFVVDGRWINDPDNPPANPEGRSTLVLVERAGMLTLGDDEATPQEGGAPRLHPSFRYSGRAFLDDGDSSSDQTFDFYFDYENERFRSHIDFRTTDEAWDASPLQTDIRFNNGYLELLFDNASILGFENERTWSSNDPFDLVGDVGIYDYSVGRGRKGAGLELGTNSRVKLRALYADRVEPGLPGPVTISAADLAGFTNSTSPDTTLYHFDTRLQDQDTWALDITADFSGLAFGYGTRRNRGFHPGVLALVERGSGDFTVEAFGTREYFDAGAAWVQWTASPVVTLQGAYGHGSMLLQRLTRSQVTVATLDDVAPGQGAQEVDSDSGLQSSRRWLGGALYQAGGWTASARFEWLRYEFEPGVYMASAANVGVTSLRFGYEGAGAGGWTLAAAASYIDQDYGATPDDFHVHARGRNPWLDYGDDLSISHLAAFDLARATELNVEVTWESADSVATPASVSLSVTVDVVSQEVLGSVDYLALRTLVEYRPWRRIYVQGDARFASYDKAWSSESFFSPYLEFGYRDRKMEFSLGLGLDPVVLDPVRNTYQNIGREEYLRQAIPARVNRSEAGALGAAVTARERALTDENAIKLEAIVHF